jgi:hypothetical protein
VPSSPSQSRTTPDIDCTKTMPTRSHVSNGGGTSEDHATDFIQIFTQAGSYVATNDAHQCRVTTRSQHGISEPKSYTDDTIRYSLLSSVGEPTSVQDALGDTNWKKAMDAESEALRGNKTWHIVSPKSGVKSLIVSEFIRLIENLILQLIGIRPN